MKNKVFEKIVAKGLSKAKYKHSETCKRDLSLVLTVYKGLQPRLEPFIFDNGDEKSLLNVNGTIPIKYRGATYNIPVCFWILPEYPMSPPMGYVQPTPDMQIKTSSSVDSNGRIYLPYITEWTSPDSSLLDLIKICVLVFGQAPPVFTKTKAKPKEQSVLPANRPNITSQSSTEAQPEISNSEVQEHASDLSAEEVKASLLTAAQDMLRSRLEEEYMKTRAEIESLHSTSKELLDGQEQIESIIEDLEKHQTDLNRHRSEMEAKSRELEEESSRLSRLQQEGIPPDELVIVDGNPVHQQLLDAVAVDAAIEDAIYTLGQALHTGVLECDQYLKKVRNLSRKQFSQRAIILKSSSSIAKSS